MSVVLTLLLFLIALMLWFIWRALDQIGEALWFIYKLADARTKERK